jgi:hypothetical protein
LSKLDFILPLIFHFMYVTMIVPGRCRDCFWPIQWRFMTDFGRSWRVTLTVKNDHGHDSSTVTVTYIKRKINCNISDYCIFSWSFPTSTVNVSYQTVLNHVRLIMYPTKKQSTVNSQIQLYTVEFGWIW